ncbi:MAG: SDR family NAD(P)-dependent oxidoreductase, partial [Anaerolineae bacterium]|nr:SDR family NAD(P)-dependent oxidoreductase [Anaerolineae bacterium]
MVTIKTIIQKYKAKEITKDQALDLLDQAKAQTAVSPSLTMPKPKILADAVKRYLARKLAQLLAVEAHEINTNENFMDLGVDSTQLIALVRDIEAEIGIELYPTLLFEHQNADALSMFMAQEYREQFSAFLKIEGEPDIAEPINLHLSQQPEQQRAASIPSNGHLNFLTDKNLDLKNRTENAGDIAVIGMAGVFPQSANVEHFWQHLYQKTNLITEIPNDHFDYKPWYAPQVQAEDTLYCKWGGFIEDVDKFDAPFFNISPREAALMDPQLRYLLQVLYHTAEDAGYAASIRSSNTGMYVGVCSHDYLQEMSRRGKKIQAHDGTGNAATMLANRPSFYFNLTGPSLALDTACSSSLYALHVACQALKGGECEMAFAAGANLLLSSTHYRYFCSIGALSPSGRCHTFDQRADGYVPGETVAAVLLKPLRQAIQDRDHIYGVIKGSAVRHGGYTPSITAPSVDGEANVLLSAWQMAGLNPETLDYIEAHGTGTQLGDPVEIEALHKAFRTYTDKTQFCGIGSAKAHIGHAEGAAGIAGLIKTLLSMQHGIIPAMPDFEELNPYIKLERSPFYINREPVAWPRKNDLPRRAGISSFGFGGAYAHVVVEECQEVEGGSQESGTAPHLIVLSARTEAQLRQYAQKMLSYLEHASTSHPTRRERNGVEPILSLAQAVQEMTANMIGVAPSEIEVEQPFEGYGLDPVQLSRLKRMVEDRYDCELPANRFLGPVSVRDVAQYVSSLETNGACNHEHTASQPALSLTNLAYSLQVGREAMKVRLAMVVSDLNTLREKLTAYLADVDPIEHLYGGRGRQNQLSVFAQDEDLQQAVGHWIRKGKLEKLAELWVAGVEMDWRLLYPNGTPRRVSLPTYPFAKERHWLTNNEEWRMENRELCNPHSQFTTAPLHPLVHTNISDLEEQRFGTTFTGNEFFLDDHRVRGEKVLPGVAYLEMARAAGAMAVRDRAVTQLKNVVWVRPLVIKDEPLETQIGLYPDEGGEIAFAISSSGVVHSQGKLVVGSMGHPPSLDIAAIQARCLSTLEGADGYARFREQGLAYGPSFQGLVQLSYNAGEALARLRLPDGVDRSGYDLHPSVLDAALQATVGLGLSRDSQGYQQLGLPFAVQTIDIYEPLPENAWAYVQFSAEGETARDGVSYDITVTNEQGAICVTLQGFTVRAFVEPVEIDLLYSRPGWQAKTLVARDEAGNAEVGEKSLLVVGLEPEVVEAVSATLNPTAVTMLDPADIPTLIRQSWRHIKAIVADKPGRPHTIVVVAADTIEYHRYAPLVGLLKTAWLEQSNIRGKIITVASLQADRLIPLLDREMRSNSFFEMEIRYDAAGSRTIKTLHEIEITTQEKRVYLRPGGVYWITGGLGGLGRIFARHLLDQGQPITVILSGRSALDAAGQQYLAELNQANGTAVYLPVDISVRADVERAVQTINARYGVLNGIIHSAGIIEDSLIINKTEAEIATVLAPKVDGALNIDAATQTKLLDFVVLFSSMAGVMGNIGQADYAAANAFLDSFADYRQALVEAGERSGRTVSINWPFWAEGGMATEESNQTMIAHQTGLLPMSTGIGLRAFETVMALSERQVIVAAGAVNKLRRTLLSAEVAAAAPTPTGKPTTHDTAWLAEKIQTDLIKSVSRILKINAEDISGDENLSEYGFDSITLTELANKLNETYALALLPTVFFEHNTLISLSRYLAEHHTDHFMRYYPNKSNPSPMSSPLTTITPSPPPAPLTKTRFRSAAKHKETHRRPTQLEAVAIIGMSGQLPGSPDLPTFWQHLVAGQDLITEIPPDRWDWRSYDGDPHSNSNKTRVKWGGFIKDVDKFDAAFFKISPHEAKLMDPQQRLWLQTVWHCIEDAGYRPGSLAGTQTGIFVGVAGKDYEELVRSHRT